MRLRPRRQAVAGRAGPEPARPVRERAWEAFAEDDFEAAARLFEQWTRAVPDSALAWFGYAWSQLQVSGDQGMEADEVLSQFRSPAERSLELNDASGELEPHQLSGIHHFLGLVDKLSGKRALAMAHFRDAINAAPDNPISVPPRIELAAHVLEQGDVAAAETLLREAQRLAPEDPTVAEFITNLETRRGRLLVRFTVYQLSPSLKVEHFEALADPGETLGEIAEREFPEHGVSPVDVRFIYSGDGALPSSFDSGNRERHETLRGLGLKDGDAVLCIALGGSPFDTEDFGTRFIRDHLDNGRPHLARREMRSAIQWATRNLETEEFALEGHLGTALRLADLFPDDRDVATLLDTVRSEIRRRDAGSACAPAAAWSHAHGGPSRTAQAARAPAPPLQQWWEFRAPSGRLTVPVVQQGRVLTGSSDQYLYCLDVRTGQERWRWRADSVLEQAPAASATAVHVTGRESLTCLDLGTGAVIWQRECAGACSPAIAGREVVAATADGLFRRLDPDSGEVIAVLDTGVRHICSVSVDSARVVGLSDSCVVCADLALQNVLWKREGSFGETTPVLAWDGIYLGTQREGLWCLDGNTGRLRWIFATAAPVKAAPAVAKGRLFFGDTGGRFGSLDARTGALLWRPRQWLTNQIACSASPAVADPFVYVLLDNGALYCLDMLSGSELWSGLAFEAEAGLGALAVIPDAILATSRLGTISCLGRSDPAERVGGSAARRVGLPARTNLLPLKTSTVETEPQDVNWRNYTRPTELATDETNQLHLALHFSINNRLDEAIAILQTLQHEHPDEPIVLYNLGDCYESQGLVGEALAVFDHLLELDPGDAWAFARLGRLLRTHPALITDVFGEAHTAEVTAPSIPAWPPGAEVALQSDGGRAAVACRIDTTLVNVLRTGSAWHWWQMMDTDNGPVLRLYVEFNYGPYRFHKMAHPVDVLDPHVANWLTHLEEQDSFTILLYDDHGAFRSARELDQPAELRARLVSLHQRALTGFHGDAKTRSFEAAVREAEARWDERQEPGSPWT